MSTACSASPLATTTRSDNDPSPSIAVHAPRPPKVLARGPLWARLPSLRPTNLSGSQSQAPAGSQAIAVPNESQNTGISFSDAVSVKRLTAANASSLTGVTIGGAGIFDSSCQPTGAQNFETIDVDGRKLALNMADSEAVIIFF